MFKCRMQPPNDDAIGRGTDNSQAIADGDVHADVEDSIDESTVDEMSPLVNQN